MSIFGISSFLPVPVDAQVQSDSKTINFLFVQDGESSSISKINSTSYSLQINGVDDEVIVFSDRPDRILQVNSIEDFTGNWTIGEDSFQQDPPNAALLLLEENNEKIDRFIIELYNINYDKDQKVLKYDFIFLDNSTATQLSDLPYNSGQTVLVIDAIAKFKAHGCEHGLPECA
jgi:hypothetical protein